MSQGRTSRSYVAPRPPAQFFLAFLIAAAFVMTAELHGQTAVPDANGRLVFKSNVHTVVVDVVVTGKNGQPVAGLHKDDFQLAEDGHGQKLTYFEEHTGKTSPSDLPQLPPHVFTNVPRVTPVDAVTVLLFDTLNTQLADQSR